jgi:hypothetical protein
MSFSPEFGGSVKLILRQAGKPRFVRKKDYSIIPNDPWCYGPGTCIAAKLVHEFLPERGAVPVALVSTSLDGLERWQGLAAIEFFDCPQVTSFARLGSLTSLETVSLGLLSQQPRDLSPLAGLPRLRELSLLGHSDFDVSSLAGARGLVVAVPPSARVAGADKLGPESRVTEQAATLCSPAARLVSAWHGVSALPF